MKKKIHPEMFEVDARCACGATYRVISTRKDVKIDLCSACHPFFTGRRSILDITGRVEKFEKRAALAQAGKKGKE